MNMASKYETEELKNEIEVSNDSCFYEGTSNLSDSSAEEKLVTDAMFADEEKMSELDAKRAAEEQEKIRREYEQRNEQQQEEHKRKRFYHLLSRSQFYMQFLVNKIDNTIQAENNKKKELKRKQEEKKRKEKSTLKEIRNASADTGAKPKQKRKREEKKKITDYVDKEMIANAARNQTDDDIFKPKEDIIMGTRLTSMGYEVPDTQPLLFEGGVLRPYQLHGLEWLKVLYENGVNGILADEMGLGKTIQVIALICHMIEKNVLGPFLIIAPLSTLPNWMMEFEKLAPQVPVVMFHGSKYVRPGLYHKLTKRVSVLGQDCAPVVLTSYQVPLLEFSVLSSMKWRYIIVDEGHVLKNINSQLAKCLRSLKSINRLLLTGTPLQNNLTELWSLLNFLLPEIFDDIAVFEALFHLEDMENSSSSIIAHEEKHRVLSTLHQILTPFLLRRLKADVEINIPPKKELLVYCPMTSIQLELYRTTVDRSIVNILRPKNNFSEIEYNPDGTRPKRNCAKKRKNYALGTESDDDFDALLPKKMDETKIAVTDKEYTTYCVRLCMVNPQMQLRKIVNHPYLVHMPVDENKYLIVNEELVNKSGKMLVIDAMLAKLKERGHKVLIFSYFKILLDLLEEVLIMRDHKFVRLDGNYKLDERKESICKFNTDPNIFVFLITTRAGGLGLNLTAADTVIIFDSDWNPQADLQAMDRCHRIGQTKPTVVYRLVTKGTVDEKMINVAGRKRKLEKVVINKGKFKFNTNKVSDLNELEELKQLLESTDHQKTIHSNGFVFSDQELDELLDRSDMLCGTVVTHDKENIDQAAKKLFKVVNTESKSDNSCDIKI